MPVTFLTPLSRLCPPDIMSSGDDHRSQALAKPAFSEAQACAVVESEFGFRVSEIQPLPSYDDQNFRVRVSRPGDAAGGPTEYVLKISNTESSKNPDLIEVQSHVAMFLHEAGFPTASVCRTWDGGVTSLVSVDSGSQTKSHVVRLLAYLPGRPVAEVPVGPRLLYEIGRLAATLDKTLEEFHHPKLRCLRREDFIWNLRNVPLLEKYLSALGPDRNREIVGEVIRLFREEVTAKLRHFREYFKSSGKVWRYNVALPNCHQNKFFWKSEVKIKNTTGPSWDPLLLII
ncbi:hydroxylysine kinase isoform X3 [Myotis yumanensis]|uniref:hydroxylysine kinase isoform X3 n=1 Tax=Myotis yumanensis TaxID=159337 RepID=UPI0038D50FA8